MTTKMKTMMTTWCCRAPMDAVTSLNPSLVRPTPLAGLVFPFLPNYHRDDHTGNEDELIEGIFLVVHAIQQIATQALHTLPTLVSTSSSSST